MLRVLIMFEVSLSVVLLVSSMLTIRSFQKLHKINLGFDPEGILSVQIFIPEMKYPEGSRQAALIEQMLERVQSIPGVAAAATVQPLPLAGTDYLTSLRIRGVPPPTPENPLNVVRRTISAGYFQAMGIPFLRGRAFTESDQSKSAPVCIINDTMAARFWPKENPIGKNIASLFDPHTLTPIWAEVVGVVGDAKQAFLTTDIHPEVYVPCKQFPVNLYPALVVRSSADPARLIDSIRQIQFAVDSEIVIYNAQTMKDLTYQALAPQRFSMTLLSAFAFMAVLIASVGFYGLLAYSVGQRKHEFGLRLALGAQKSHILRLVVGEGMRLGVCGIIAGLLMAFGLSRVMSSLLYGISPEDPLTFGMVPWFVLASTALACYFPARRAAQSDPLIALRSE
jgi:putative ABC transport system permease protein